MTKKDNQTEGVKPAKKKKKGSGTKGKAPEQVDPISFNELQTIYTDNFPELWTPFRAALAVMAQHYITDIANPFTLIFQGPPSGGKTTVLSCFMGLDEHVYWSDQFTAAAFVSHSSTTSKKDLKEVDMLPKIRHKTLITPELSTIFSARKERLMETMGVLTRILDGNGFTKDTGAHGSRGYQGDYFFTWLGATTPIRPHVWNIMSIIGARMFFTNVSPDTKSDEDMMLRIMGEDSYDVKLKNVKKATSAFFAGLRKAHPTRIEWSRSTEDKSVAKVIMRLAKLLSKLRGAVELSKGTVDQHGDTDFSYMPPIFEDPTRAATMLYNLARGNALIHGRTQISHADLPMVIEIALSSAPLERVNVFSALLKEGTLTTEDTADVLNCSLPNARKVMKKLEVLQLVEVSERSDGFGGQPTIFIDVTYDLMWFRSKEFRATRKGI